MILAACNIKTNFIIRRSYEEVHQLSPPDLEVPQYPLYDGGDMKLPNAGKRSLFEPQTHHTPYLIVLNIAWRSLVISWDFAGVAVFDFKISLTMCLSWFESGESSHVPRHVGWCVGTQAVDTVRQERSRKEDTQNQKANRIIYKFSLLYIPRNNSFTNIAKLPWYHLVI